ncbi:MAG: CPBP family intramembrane glutamic endopeptidase [Nitrososphaerota archaeon]
MNLTNIKDILYFSLTAILLASLVDYVFYIGLISLNGSSILVWGFLRMYTPAFSTYIVGGWSEVKNSLKISRPVFYLYFVAPLITFLTFSIYLIVVYSIGVFSFDSIKQTVQSASLSASTIILLTIINAYIASTTLNALFAVGEEIGWRGFLQRKLESLGLNFVTASLIVGLVWGIWHAPAIILLGFNYPENRFVGTLLFTLFTISASIPHSVIRKVSSSILPAASLHGAINALWGLTILITVLPREIAGLGPIAIFSWTTTSLIMLMVYRRLKKGSIAHLFLTENFQCFGEISYLRTEVYCKYYVTKRHDTD